MGKCQRKDYCWDNARTDAPINRFSGSAAYASGLKTRVEVRNAGPGAFEVLLTSAPDTGRMGLLIRMV